MHPDPDLRRWLSHPTSVGASHIVLAQLDRVLKAFRELDRTDPETLHEFRVAIRRLRSLILAYEGVLGHLVRKRVRRALRTVAHATNASRDADVHSAWILDQRDGLRLAERRGADWLRAQVGRERSEADAEFEETLSPGVHRTLQRFRKQLRAAAQGRGARNRRRAASDTMLTLAAETADQLRRLADDLARRLRAIASPDDAEALHTARIAAKHLRYVLEPLADDVVFPAVPAFVERLKTLQDVLGDLHDTTVFADDIARHLRRAGHEGARQVAAAIRTHVSSDSATFHRAVAEAQLRDPVPGLVALAERLQSRHEAGYQRAHQEWLANYASVAVMPAYELAGALDAVSVAGPEILGQR